MDGGRSKYRSSQIKIYLQLSYLHDIHANLAGTSARLSNPIQLFIFLTCEMFWIVRSIILGQFKKYPEIFAPSVGGQNQS